MQVSRIRLVTRHLASALTQTGILLGTAAYMAPEQARGRSVDERADIWAFGCVLFEMLAGRTPFAGESVTDVLAKVIQREPDWSALPQQRRRLSVDCCGDASKRTRSAGSQPSPMPASSWMRPRHRRRQTRRALGRVRSARRRCVQPLSPWR